MSNTRRAKMPMKVSEEMVAKFAVPLKPGTWVIADITERGMFPPIAPKQYDTFEECQNECDALNKRNGISKEKVQEMMQKHFTNTNT